MKEMINKKILILISLFLFLLLFVGCFVDPPINNAPTIISTPITTTTVDVLYNYDVDATDLDGSDTLTYALTTSPVGMTINSATGVISWTPSTKGDYDVTVEVSDGELSATQSFTITVSESNHAPVITSTPVTSATKDEPYSYNVDATDSDGDTLVYSLTTKPTGMSINSSTGLIAWTPTTSGDYDVTVEVSDGELLDTQSFEITVDDPCDPCDPCSPCYDPCDPCDDPDPCDPCDPCSPCYDPCDPCDDPDPCDPCDPCA